MRRDRGACAQPLAFFFPRRHRRAHTIAQSRSNISKAGIEGPPASSFGLGEQSERCLVCFFSFRIPFFRIPGAGVGSFRPAFFLRKLALRREKRHFVRYGKGKKDCMMQEAITDAVKGEVFNSNNLFFPSSRVFAAAVARFSTSHLLPPTDRETLFPSLSTSFFPRPAPIKVFFQFERKLFLSEPRESERQKGSPRRTKKMPGVPFLRDSFFSLGFPLL